ncbi:COX15/CtaA family protein [Egicoccus halophilus]|uniref:Cytochrome b561 n=1 Tax=Egicoccus halophilus TaxID=1670830 RepID=A0A8J3EYD7_9ACTN|nr:COX15/CtaA family protein [Egicoccus halophilus]GGI07664.1 cytochrome b561 [Egicoccus halophilus]
MATSPAPASLRLLRRFTLAALVTNIGIVFTGGVVRVTGSGLGCPTWPACDGRQLVPTPGGDHAGWQTAIEFGNRLLTFVVLAAAIAVFVQLRRTGPHPRPIRLLGWALPLGVLAQAVMGGITVLLRLTPWTVAAHFLLSMVLIAVAVALHEYVRPPARDPADRVPASSGIRWATTVLLVVAAVVLVLGTIVTGAGPHAGDPEVPRLGVDIRFVAIAHADAVWLLLGLTVALVAVTWRSGPPRLRSMLRVLLGLELLQGTIGYTQYALGIPEGLVSLHILGAALVWAAAVSCWARARPLPDLPGDPADTEASRPPLARDVSTA